MDDMLILLLKYGAHRKGVKITTAELGEELGMSQQNTSRRLIELEKDGMIERSENGIVLTDRAYEEIMALYSSLKVILEKTAVEITGTITSGLGEGSYYLSLPAYRKQIKQLLGFDPYPGTLNIKLPPEEGWKKKYLLQLDSVMIPGFRDAKRSYGAIFAHRCSLEDQECAVIIPMRTHHGPDILEIISEANIKQKFRKKDGDRIRVMI